MAAWIKMSLGMELGFGPGDFVLDGDPTPPPQKGAKPPKFSEPPHFLAHVYCGQMAVWIKIAIGMEVGLGPVHIVLDGHSSPPQKRGQSCPIFGPSLLCPNGCMDQDATWYGGRPQPTQHCVRCGPSYTQKKDTPTPTQFWPVVAKWLDG